MRLNWINPCGSKQRSVALGTFDGVHLGHQELLRRAVINQPANGCSSVFTFDYPPEQVFSNDIQLVSDFGTRQRLIFAAGISEILWVEFNRDFAQISAPQFIEDILVRALRAKHVVCGFNFRFGKRAQGDAKLLQQAGEQFGFNVDIVPPCEWDGETISSTRIRKAIQAGDMTLAGQLLGRYQSYIGTVTDGAKRGRKLGFPTANLQIPPEFVLPADGVYLTWCYFDNKSYPSVTAVSDNPTFDGTDKTVEAFILDYHGDLYGTEIELQFLAKMRDIYRYQSVEELQRQIQADVESAKQQLQSYHLQDGRIVLK